MLPSSTGKSSPRPMPAAPAGSTYDKMHTLSQAHGHILQGKLCSVLFGKMVDNEHKHGPFWLLRPIIARAVLNPC